jgi:hypothetical protein
MNPDDPNWSYSSSDTALRRVLYDSLMPAIAKLTLCALTGWEVDRDDGDWVELRSGGDVTLAFQHAPDHQPPSWPSADHPQQAHLDFDVDDLDIGEAAVIELGARKTDVQPMPDSFRVFLDPAGHPFCLVLAD